jgi:hypothetical protein
MDQPIIETVEVFKTNVQKDAHARQLVKKLLALFHHCKINFDLQDCDKILRVAGIAGIDICPEKIIRVINRSGYQCEVLP